MNVVPRNTMNGKWQNRELTLKCKFKYYVKPMKHPLGVCPSKGNQGTPRGKKKILTNGRSNPEGMGSIPTEVKKNFSLPRVVS